jgi:hypothetical protein
MLHRTSLSDRFIEILRLHFQAAAYDMRRSHNVCRRKPNGLALKRRVEIMRRNLQNLIILELPCLYERR